jgi:[DsrC]-trisulfide reductase subunit P
MLEKALFQGSKRYWSWVAALLFLIGLGSWFFLKQLNYGLGITGMGRDVSWGLYIAQLTFMVGIAASAVMVVLPYYLHDYKAFGSITILGEYLAIPSVIVAILFVTIDLGCPQRVLNLLLYPTPTTPLFWDLMALPGYVLLNIIIAKTTLNARINDTSPPKWIKPVIYLSIPWAFSIHTVTAFIYSGLAARPFWHTAILAPRFLASAFASGPALLILIILILEKVSPVRIERKAVEKLAQIVTYALVANIFFFALEPFTVFYGGIPHHQQAFEYLLFGLEGHHRMVPFAWISIVLSIAAMLILLLPNLRKNTSWLSFSCVILIVALWIDKGLNLIVAGFIPNQLEQVVEYSPTFPEVAITIGIYALGALIFTLLCKVYIYHFEQIKQ